MPLVRRHLASLVSALEERAESGEPHAGGRRRLGYEKDGRTINEAEAEIVREVFDRYLKGQNPLKISHILNERGILTSRGKTWTSGTVRALLGSHHVAGLRVHRGELIGEGTWPAIIDRGTWEEAQRRREFRSAIHQENLARRRFYLLRGIVICERCGTHMSGSELGGVPNYCCTRRHRGKSDEARCVRKIAAIKLEKFVEDAAIDLLGKLTVSGELSSTALPPSLVEQIESDEQQLRELKEMWRAKEMPTAEYREERKIIEARIATAQRRATVRPLKLLEGLTGPNAERAWRDEKLSDERRNAILHFLFAAIRIGPSTKPNGVFDWDRIDIEQNPL